MTKPLLYPWAALLAGVTAACSVYDASLMEKSLASVPDRPAASTSSPNDDVEAVFALRNISLDQGDGRWRRLGLDLDGMNTAQPGDPGECTAASGEAVLDGEKGIDNSFGQHVLPTVLTVIPCLEDNIALNQGLGLGTVLLRLREWNGAPNDAKVDASVLSAVDGTSLQDVSNLEWGGLDGATLLQAGGSVEAPAPAWDGQDTFFVDPASLVAGRLSHPLVWKTDAYVRDGRVVLPVDTAAAFVFLTGPGSFSISINGFLLADISEDGQTLEKGLLAGRFSAGEMLATLLPLGICNQALRDSVTGPLTNNLDLRSASTLGSPDEPCTATSVAFTFQGVRARISDTVAPVELPIPEPCAGNPIGGLEPAFDRCCRSVELSNPAQLPANCSSERLRLYSELPNPIPVPPEEGF